MNKLKKLALGLIVIVGYNSCSDQKEENDWSRDNLRGKVKTYTDFSYKAEERFGKI